ncbi:MAG TPA: hypothetical protein VLC55_10310, partial [Burkholderiales bacterium]|nr:hypothetical protein [Burkholderiales bacterium]
MTPARRRPLPPTAPRGAQPKPIAAALAAALLAGTPAAAMTLGDLALESGIGQPLRARIPVSLQPGEELSAGCVSLVRPPGDAPGQYLTRAALDVTGNGREILISTPYAIETPVVYLRLRAGCGPDILIREYTVLPDPPGMRPAPAPVPATVAPPPPPPRPATASPAPHWELRAGDTARDIAAAVYPADPALQERLADAIMRANPEAFPGGDPGEPAIGSAIVFPDLRSIGLKSATATAATRQEAPRTPATPAPGAAPLPERKTEVTTLPPVTAPLPERQRKPSSDDRSVPGLATGRVGGAPSRLQLSSSDRNLARSMRLSDEERALLEELHKLEADDQMSRIAALKQRVADLEAQFAAVRASIEREAERAPKPPTAAVAPAGVETDLSLPLLGAGLGIAILLALFFAQRQLRKAQQDAQPRGAVAAPLPVPRPQQAPAVAMPVVEAAVAEVKATPETRPDARTVDSILEEAQLLMIHGHPLRAIKLLEQQIQTTGGEVRLWMLLFVLLR